MQVMKALLFCFALIAATPIVAADERIPDYSQHYDPERDPFADGRDAIANATATQRRVLIELGGNWCAWCKKLERFINSNKRVKKKLYDHFVVLKVNVSDENQNHEFLATFPKVTGYPHFFITHSDGSVLTSKDTAGFLQEGEYSERRFLRFIDLWGINNKATMTAYE